GSRSGWVRRSTSVNEGPGSSPGPYQGRGRSVTAGEPRPARDHGRKRTEGSGVGKAPSGARRPRKTQGGWVSATPTTLPTTTRDGPGPTTAAAPPGGRLLAALLDVVPDELLGVLLEHRVDLVEEVVELFLDLLALLGRRGRVSLAWRPVVGGGALLVSALGHTREP